MHVTGRFAVTTAVLSSLMAAPGCGGSSGNSTPGPGGGDASASASPEGSLPQACTPGQQVACACPGSMVTGAQTCDPSGHGYGRCDGCPSVDASSGPSDGAVGHDATAHADASTSGPSFDGTSGKPCTTSADCKGTNGPGVNVCSNSLTYSANAMIVNPLPTPVCMFPPGNGNGGNCDPAPPSDPSAQLPHFCDGPDSPTSPGICVAVSSGAHVGSCSPMCVFALDGSTPTGCAGLDTCGLTAFIALDTNSQLFGWGSCLGTCEKSADCAALGSGYTCQTDTGYCTASPVTRPKHLGQACTASDITTGACNCLPGMSGSGYCTSACVVGGAPCANGWRCDTLQSASVHVGGNVFPVPAENAGMSGLCVAPCTAPDGGPALCPPNSTCQSGTPLGPACLP